MYDANAKFPSGVLNGNINQLGDFEQCLRVTEKTEVFMGQYCLTTVQLALPKDKKYLNLLRKLVLSNEPFESSIEDTRTFVPKSSEIYWGLCVPSSCSSAEVSGMLKSHISLKTNIPEFYWKVKVKHGMCQVRDENWMGNLSFTEKLAMLEFF